MGAEWKNYRRQLARRLPCSRKRRRELLSSLTAAYEELRQEAPAPTRQQLEEAFGPPEELAQVLSDRLDHTEVARFRRGQMGGRIALGMLVVAVLALSIYVFWLKEARVFWIPVAVHDGAIGFWEYLGSLFRELFLF